MASSSILHLRPLKTDYLPNIGFPPWVISPCAANSPFSFPHLRSIESAQVTENRTPKVGKTRALSKGVRGC